MSLAKGERFDSKVAICAAAIKLNNLLGKSHYARRSCNKQLVLRCSSIAQRALGLLLDRQSGSLELWDGHLLLDKRLFDTLSFRPAFPLWDHRPRLQLSWFELCFLEVSQCVNTSVLTALCRCMVRLMGPLTGSWAPDWVRCLTTLTEPVSRDHTDSPVRLLSGSGTGK